MENKPALTIADQIQLLKSRGMLFRDEKEASIHLLTISYYRLKGYWWDMQTDLTKHTFGEGVYFEDVIARYYFDKRLRTILFDAIEYIEIALRTKMIYYLSITYGPLWYLDANIFESDTKIIHEVEKTMHLHAVDELKRDLDRSHEIFIKDHKERYPDKPIDCWKALEVASIGTLSKLYKSLKHQLPED